MDVTFKINGKAFNHKLSTYFTYKEVSAQYMLTALDDEEIPGPALLRDIIEVSFWPLTEQENIELFDEISGLVVEIEATNPDTGKIIEQKMRLTTNIEKTFLLKSVDGNRYYNGGILQFRGVKPYASNK
jgi:hypothetical protein